MSEWLSLRRNVKPNDRQTEGRTDKVSERLSSDLDDEGDYYVKT